MKVKKFVVDSMPDALQKIRSELGKDAVIINTKEIRVGGFLGMFAKKKVEVVAATDSNPDSGASSRAAAAVARLPRHSLKVSETFDSLSQAPPQPAPATVAVAAKLAQSAVSTGVEDALLQEMKQMREMMQRLASAQAGVGAVAPAPAQGNLPAPFETLRQRLVAQDVREELALQIVVQAMESLEGGANDDVPALSAKGAVKDRLVSLLSARPIERIRDDAKVVHFVGPTGVGKTTTIAKLAAEQALKHRKSIGLITSDTYRIAAIEQLRTYASILNIPLEVVFSPVDLQKALDKMSECDMILMDTAGRNFRSEMAVSELHSLLRTQEKRDTLLVLSLSMKYSDMKAVTDNFYKFGLQKVLFTKADETTTFGSIVNLLADFPLSLSYITHGQNVPDDIYVADANRMADELVGGGNDE